MILLVDCNDASKVRRHNFSHCNQLSASQHELERLQRDQSSTVKQSEKHIGDQNRLQVGYYTEHLAMYEVFAAFVGIISINQSWACGSLYRVVDKPTCLSPSNMWPVCAGAVQPPEQADWRAEQ